MHKIWIWIASLSSVGAIVWYLGITQFLWVCLWILGPIVAVALIRAILYAVFRVFWENFATKKESDE